MKNITVSIPDETFRRARILAAERGSSVSSLVAEYLVSLDHAAARFERLEALQDEVLESVEEFSACDRASRDEIHDRALRPAGQDRPMSSHGRGSALARG